MSAFLSAFRAVFSIENDVADLFNILICAGVLSYIVYGGVALYAHTELWNPLTYGGGLGTLLATSGAALRFRDGPTNPTPVVGPIIKA